MVGSSNFNSKFDKTCCFVPSFMSFFLLFFRKIQWSFFFLTIWSFLLFSGVLSWATLGKALQGHIKKQVCTECLFVCLFVSRVGSLLCLTNPIRICWVPQKESQQHPVFQGGQPSKHWLGSALNVTSQEFQSSIGSFKVSPATFNPWQHWEQNYAFMSFFLFF